MLALFTFVTDTIEIPLAWVASVVLALVSALGIVFKLYLRGQRDLLREKEEKYRVLATLKAKADEKRKNGNDVGKGNTDVSL